MFEAIGKITVIFLCLMGIVNTIKYIYNKLS